MKISTDRILTTHVGSLPRPASLEAKLLARERGELDAASLDAMPDEITTAVRDVVKRQADLGISIVDDGEMSKYAYATYARDRMTGLTGVDHPLALSELTEFPEFASKIVMEIKTPACVGPLSYHGDEHVASDINNLKAALEGVAVEDAFMNASSPGIMAHYMPNKFYATQEEYLYALADTMKREYDAIVASGLLLQIDCPELALGRHFRAQPMEVADFRKEVALHVEEIGRAHV